LAATDSALPTNLDAERSVLGAVLLNTEALKKTLQIHLAPDDFFIDPHRRIFRAFIRMSDDNRSIDSLTLTEELTTTKELRAVGGESFISSLIDGVPRISNVAFYAGIVRENAHLRRLAHLGDALKQSILEKDDPSEIISAIQAEQSVTRNGTQPIELKVADMPEEVLDGYLGEVCRNRMSRFPVAYAWPALAAIAGAMIPKNNSPLRSNLYVGLIGPIHSGKTQAEDYARRIMGIDPPRLQAVMSGSAEGLLGKLKDADGEGRLVCPDELGHLFAKAGIENASFPFILNRAFYQSQFDLTSARGKIIRFNSSLSLLGGLVDSDFQRYFDSGTIGGLHDRFIFGVCPDPFTFDYQPFSGEPETFIKMPEAPYVDPGVWELKKQWLNDNPALTPRVCEIALRVAGICAAFDGRTVLRVADLSPALAFAKHQAQVRVVFSPNPGENPDAHCGFAVVSHLQHYDGWVNRREFYRKVHASRYGSGIFNRVLMSLAQQGEIELTRNGKEMRVMK
jgi:DnaB helicase-like protein